MKQFLRSWLVLLITVIFLFGSTGITFFIHECGSSQTKEVFVYPEILKHQSSCCCAEEVHGTPSVATALQFSDPDCCKNTHLFIKASFLGFPVFNKHQEEPIRNILSSDHQDFMVRPVEPIKVLFTSLQDPSPPPLSGRLLIQAIHQIKIPVPFS